VPDTSPNARKPWRQYARLLRPELADLRWIIVYGAAIAILALAVPLTVDALISNVTFGTLLTPLVVLVGILLGCLVMQGVLQAVQKFVAEIIERRIFVRVVSDLTWRLPRVDVQAFDQSYGPELVNRFFDTMTVQKSSSQLLLELTNIALTTIVGMAVLAFYHPFFLAFVVLLLAAVALLVLVLGRGGVSTAVDVSSAKYEVAAWLQEIARHTTAFCTKGGADFARQRSEILATSYIAARKRHFRVLFQQVCGALGLQVLASTAVLAIGGWLVIEQQLSVGQLVASELIVSAVVASITKLSRIFESWYEVCAAAGKVGKLIDLPLERQTGEALPSSRGVRLELRDVQCDDNRSLHSAPPFRMTIAAGERIALVGSIDGAASRLLDVLYGLRNPRTGHVTVDGLDLRQLRLDLARDEFALVHGTEIVEGTVLENIQFGRQAITASQIRSALDDVGLWNNIMELPGGLEAPLTTHGLPLSACQATQLMLARAIVGEPRLLLLDGALDRLRPKMRARVIEHFFARRHGWTMLVVTSLPDVIAVCDRSFDVEPEFASAARPIGEDRARPARDAEGAGDG